MRHALIFLVLALLLTACSTPQRADGPYQPQTDADRNTLRAERLSRQAAALIEDDPVQAERLLRDALTADLFYGPAHNNLGVVYLNDGRLYEAAGEFEWANKLMPGNPDSRMNLGLTLERAGRIDQAIETYQIALEVAPSDVASMQALSRCLLRNDRADTRVTPMLEEIALRGESEEWRTWAGRQLAGRRD